MRAFQGATPVARTYSRISRVFRRSFAFNLFMPRGWICWLARIVLLLLEPCAGGPAESGLRGGTGTGCCLLFGCLEWPLRFNARMLGLPRPALDSEPGVAVRDGCSVTSGFTTGGSDGAGEASG